MRQTYIAGTEPPDEPQIVAVADALDAWLAAKKKQALANEATQIRHQTLLEALGEHGLERYPYLDERGQKRYVVADKTPRARTVAAPRKPRSDRDEQDDGDPAEPAPDNVVEMRRVKRTPAHDAALDPFAATRAAMDETPPETPRRGKGKRGK